MIQTENIRNQYKKNKKNMFRNKKIIIEQYVNPFSTKCGVNGDNRCGDNRSNLAGKFYKKYTSTSSPNSDISEWFESPIFIGTSDGIKNYCTNEETMRSLYDFANQAGIKVGTSDEFVQDYFCDLSWVSSSTEYSGNCLSSRGGAVSQDERIKYSEEQRKQEKLAAEQDAIARLKAEEEARKKAQQVKDINDAQQRALGAKLERERIAAEKARQEAEQLKAAQSSQPNLVPVPIDPNEALRDKKGSYKKLIGKQ